MKSTAPVILCVLTPHPRRPIARSTRSVRVGVAIVVALLCLGSATAARADSSRAGFTLEMSVPSPVVVGHPAMLQVTGTIPEDVVEFSYWFSLSAIPTSFTTTCPADHHVAKQFALTSGGAVIIWTQREPADATGRFSIPVAVSPTAPGSVLLCGYTDDGATHTLAAASLMLQIQPAGSPTSEPRGWRYIPAEVRKGKRSCRALFAPSKADDCIRRLVRDANRYCRRLPARRSRGRVPARRAARRALLGPEPGASFPPPALLGMWTSSA
jgi:hypothetical protein